MCSFPVGLYVLQWLVCSAGSDGILLVITLEIFEFAILVRVQFLLYAAEGVEPEY